MSRRLPGATDSERLTLSTIKDSDQLTTRHNPGTLDDVDLGTAKKILQAMPVFVCTSSAATIAKTASLQDSFPDFELVNGRTIIVYMANANTAVTPTLNVQYTGAIPLDGDYWQAGTFIKCQYVDITVNGNRIRRWVMDQGANNVKAQLNGALPNIIKSAGIELYTERCGKKRTAYINGIIPGSNGIIASYGDSDFPNTIYTAPAVLQYTPSGLNETFSAFVQIDTSGVIRAFWFTDGAVSSLANENHNITAQISWFVP